MEFSLENNIKPLSLDLCESKISIWNNFVPINVASDINGRKMQCFYTICASPKPFCETALKLEVT
jgi:hypothetical protein